MCEGMSGHVRAEQKHRSEDKTGYGILVRSKTRRRIRMQVKR